MSLLRGSLFKRKDKGISVIKVNIYSLECNYLGLYYDGTFKEFIEEMNSGKFVKLTGDGKTWYINPEFCTAFEEVI